MSEAPQFDEELLANAWKLDPCTYAEKLSEGRWKAYRHLRYMSDRITDAVIKGGARIIVDMPPRHGKSEFISNWFCQWFLDMFPEKRVILASYAAEFASEWGGKVLGGLRESGSDAIDKSARRSDNFKTAWGGGMKTAGAGGPLTGFGFHLGIVDDPVKNWEEAASPTYRQKVIDWWQSTFWTRREPGASVIVVMTRWHEEDLVGWLLDNDNDGRWEVITFPAIAEEHDVLGRKPGEALCPERYDEDDLAEIKQSVGSRVWAGLYQQRPAPDDGNIFRPEWFKWYEPQLLNEDNVSRVFTSWDLTFGDEGTSYIVGQAWACMKDGNYYLLDQVRTKTDYVGAKRTFALFLDAQEERWGKLVRGHLIEQAANGKALISEMRRSFDNIVPIPIPSAHKVTRAIACSPKIEGGYVWLPKQPWVEDVFMPEMLHFPFGKNDDQVDAMSQFLNYIGGARATPRVAFDPNQGTRKNPFDHGDRR